MKEIAKINDLALDEKNDRGEVKQKVLDLCKQFPLYE